jgi:hypothetical protein
MDGIQKPSVWRFFENLGKRKRLLSTLTIAGGIALAASALPPDAVRERILPGRGS